MTRPIYTCHELFGGFLQRAGVTNGVAGLAVELDRELDPRYHRVQYHPYRTDVLDHAQYLAFLAGCRGVDVRINVYAFSYGGDTACRFCDALEAVGLRAHQVVLCDPVARFRYAYTMLPKWMRRRPLRGLVDCFRPSLRFPASVGSIHVFEQTVQPPWPSQVYHGERRVQPQRLPYPHVHMDNSTEFREACLSAAHGIYDLKGKCEL